MKCEEGMDQNVSFQSSQRQKFSGCYRHLYNIRQNRKPTVTGKKHEIAGHLEIFWLLEE